MELIYNKKIGGAIKWKEHSNQKIDKKRKNMDLWKECQQDQEEMY